MSVEPVDEVLKEIWAVKDAISAEHGGSVRSLAERLRKQDRPSTQKVVNFEKDGAKP